ncbi:hypothetical protein CAEBREN_07042 [Caenorhabditis brenneri]|uniref:Uncharacterized protein n=1 Tax=Caenorhabditis brenneri TaxID=135651 RepID=G0N3W5_CAEBE|nr:hypothetical protein CAEBREN_07042 [Caenorhabditis brenneri]
MSNITCATTVELDRLASLNFLISQIVDLIAVLITLGSSVFTVKMIMTKSIFQNSTIILLLLNLFYAVLYQVIYGIEAAIVIYKHFFMQDHPCELLQLESNCASYLKALLGAASGMILCQTGMILERTFATFLHNYESKKSLIIGSSIAIFIFIVSSQTGRIVYWDDSLSGAVLACFVFPKQTSWRSTKYFFVCTAVTVFNLVISIILKRYNKKLEYQIRFKISARFHKREVIESTGTICFLTFTQFIFMFIYSFGVSFMKTIRSYIEPGTYFFWVVWFYTVPFIAMLFPLLLMYRIRSTRAKRSQKIIGISNKKLTQEEHINQIKSMWK